MANSDIVVVGGGLSGLSAAWEIRKRDPNLKITILEAKDRLGGRTLSRPLKTAHGEDVWDLGGQWVSRSHKHMLETLSELKLETYSQFIEGKKFIHLSGDSVRSYNRTIPNLSLSFMLDIERNVRKMKNISDTIPVGHVMDHPDVEYYDNMTLETLINKYSWTDSAVRMMRLAVQTMSGAAPAQLSAWFFLTLCASTGGGFDRMLEACKGGAQELKVKGGTQQISNLIAEKIGLENVHLSEPVTAIKEADNRVQVFTKSGKVFNAKRVIVAIPVHLNADIEYVPSLPMRKLFLHKNMPVGNVVKIIVVYETAFWRDKGMSGEVINEGKQDDVYEAIDVVFDATSSNGSAALVAFMSGRRGIFWSEAQPEERKQAVLKCLFKFFGAEALTPVSYVEQNWYLEPYNRGAPISLCGPGFADVYSMLRVPHGCVHWAGTEASLEWIGYMEGAVSAGKHAALQVLLKLRPDLLTQEEKKTLQASTLQRRKSQMLRQKHKVFRYTVGLGLLAIGAIILKKTYFRIAI